MSEKMTESNTGTALEAADVVQLGRLPPRHWLLMLLAVGLLTLIFFEGLVKMVEAWGQEEYSHGYMLPVVAAFLVWQRSTRLACTPFASNWWGVLITALGLGVFVAGELGTLYTVIQYGLLITLGGLLLSFMGWRAFRLILPAYGLLFFTVPLPNFLYNTLSSQLQLISSELGVSVIRSFGITVFLEGNVIDLGDYQLQVVEACNGLRYLFPLAALGYIAAVLFKGAWWKRILLVVSTLPITVLMNSFRIGVIGVLVNRYGVSQAEGFLHDFEGWVIFMASAVLLVGEMALLARIGRDRRPLLDAFAIEGPEPPPRSARVVRRRLTASFMAALPVLLLVAVVAQILPQRAEIVPERNRFLFFPSDIGDWRGRVGQLEQIYVDALRFDDYLLSDYTDGRGESINLYVAYYASQRKGASVHSPKTCLPGGGWRLREFSQREITGPGIGARVLRVNRSLIQMGDERLLVYYWFQQRGRLMTNEYLVKWFLFWDALTRQRTDGALVRVTTPVPLGSDGTDEDARLTAFVNVIARPLERFIPD